MCYCQQTITELPISPQAFPIYLKMFVMSNWFLWRSLNYFCAPGRCCAIPRKLTLTQALNGHHFAVTEWWSEGTSGDLPLQTRVKTGLSRVGCSGHFPACSRGHLLFDLRFQLIALLLQTESLSRNLYGETNSQFPIAGPAAGYAFAQYSISVKKALNMHRRGECEKILKL